jgi:PAS domain S-box-containing protein
MDWIIVGQIVFLFVAAIFSVAMAWIVWRRLLPGSKVGAIGILAVAGWLFATMIQQVAVGGLEWKIFWDNVKYISFLAIPSAWFIYTLVFTGREKWITRRLIVLLIIPQLITLILVFTNSFHHLVKVNERLSPDGRFFMRDYGPWLRIYAIHAYGLIAWGLLLLMQTLIRSRRLYRWQATALTLAILTPWTVNILADAFGLFPYLGTYVTQMTLGVTLPAIAWGFLHLRRRDVAPVARGMVFDGMEDSVLVLDPSNRIVEMNPAARRLVGYHAPQTLEQPVEPPLPDWLTGILTPSGKDESRTITHEGEGASRFYDVRVSPLADWRGQVLSRVVVLRDITGRKQAEAALRESESRFRSVIEQASDSIALCDEQGNIVAWNSASEQLTGLKRTDVVGRPIWDVQFALLPEVHRTPDLYEQIHSTVIQALHTGQAPWLNQTTEGEIQHSDGTRRYVQQSVFSVQTAKGVMLCGMSRDITERRQAEEQLQASLNEKEMLLKEVHHRVKNNLQIVSSLLNLQSTKMNDPSGLAMLQDSQNRVRSMALIHEKLYRSQDLARVDIGEYARHLAAELFRTYRASAQTIMLEVNAAKDIWLGIDQALPVGLILNELVSNSLKHAFPEGRTGRVRIELERNTSDAVELIVADNGVGLPGDLDFRQTGSLGLQLVMTLVDQLAGTIELDSADGTVFRVTFPASTTDSRSKP